MKVYNGSGKEIILGSEIGKGGEGSVYNVSQFQNIVAKIYHNPIDKEKAHKIKAMIDLKNDRILKIAAWPLDTIHSKSNGQIIGLLMPNVSGFKDIHKLYSPKSRLSEFPSAGWPFLLHTAGNLARSFSVIHEYGHVIGDVNHGNVVVSDKATVMLIDCDSFQIEYCGQKHLCEVGVSTHQPPEFQNIKSFRGIARTQNHDNFGLAVLIFQLLFMGRHPFSGSFLGTGEMSLEKAIQEFRFAYGISAKLKQMKQPPNTLSLSNVTPKLASLFEQAFSPEGIKVNNRPKPKEWVIALDEQIKELKKCSNNNTHMYLKSVHACPWCEIESKTGIVLFNFAELTLESKKGFNISIVWNQITQIQSPGQAPKLPNMKNYSAEPDPRIKRSSRKYKLRLAIIFIIVLSIIIAGLILFGIAGVFWGIAIAIIIVTVCVLSQSEYSSIKSEVNNSFSLIQKRLRNLEEKWELEAGEIEFCKKMDELSKVKQGYQNLHSQREKKMHQVNQDRYKHQLEKFLDGFDIDRASIEGIGPGRKATLQSYGIQTASDIEKQAIMKIQGFGPVYTGKLLNWKQSIEKKFTFNPNQPIDPLLIVKIDNEIKLEKCKLEKLLLSGTNELKLITYKVLNRRQFLLAEYEQCLKECAQAEANINAL
ncbi:helix-hairpin-helix domain-containing protein [Acetivibrio cellulolyticus]|uniref:helix-hairpin-helix domain-containing protein n=1 Tax=Acetivibrio cellulolyticus TaxID=35830 RepID=UPI0001E2F100|nr:hypothetical protein [Acetivibrio cellulolyticus]